jgi:hypothetical protein
MAYVRPCSCLALTQRRSSEALEKRTAGGCICVPASHVCVRLRMGSRVGGTWPRRWGGACRLGVRPAGTVAHVVRCAGKARQPPLCSLRLCWAGCVQASDARRAVMLCLLCCFLWVVCVRVGWMAVGLVCFFCFSCVFFAFLGSQWRIWAFGKKMSFLCYVGRSGRGL